MEDIFDFDSVSISEDNSKVIILDQTLLPGKEKFIEICSLPELVEAIVNLRVRGAPAIGVAAALGIAVILKQSKKNNITDLTAELEDISEQLVNSRPTAVNLKWAIDKIKAKFFESALVSDGNIAKILDTLIEEARMIKKADIEMSLQIARNGLTLLKPGMTILTHCNAGHLAVSRFGTALAPIYLGNSKGYGFKVFADETRPLLQGARLTTYELNRAGIDVTLICDNMASLVMAQKKIDVVVVGCDRIAANGDVANKIGTSALAVLAKHYNIPFYVLGPDSTVDLNTASGDKIIIEERPEYEVTDLWYSQKMAPDGIRVYNPAFDITPSSLITAIVTDKGIFRYPYDFSR
jgi:methylthioribose-1-phosphate isomerase